MYIYGKALAPYHVHDISDTECAVEHMTFTELCYYSDQESDKDNQHAIVTQPIPNIIKEPKA